MQLSKSEEELMNIVWKLKKAYMKDILDAYPEPKPATTTVATTLPLLSSDIIACKLSCTSTPSTPMAAAN